MSNPKLKPCPFCGEKERIYLHCLSYPNYVVCLKCFATSGSDKEEKFAIKKWNTRAEDKTK